MKLSFNIERVVLLSLLAISLAWGFEQRKTKQGYEGKYNQAVLNNEVIANENLELKETVKNNHVIYKEKFISVKKVIRDTVVKNDTLIQIDTLLPVKDPQIDFELQIIRAELEECQKEVKDIEFVTPSNDTIEEPVKEKFFKRLINKIKKKLNKAT
jgi:hypothetical protein